MAKVDDQIVALQAIALETAAQTAAINAQTVAIQAMTAAVQAQSVDMTEMAISTKYQAESLDHYVDYMTGTVLHDVPLP